MAIEVRVPRLGWSMDEGTLTEWLKRDGDHVRPGDALFVLEGEKATQDIESIDEGILRLPPGSPQAGAAVKVGQIVAWLVAEGETLDVAAPTSSSNVAASISAAPLPPQRPEAPRPVVPSARPIGLGPAARRQARQLAASQGAKVLGLAQSRIVPQADRPSAPQAAAAHASPRARRAARSLGIDWRGIVGTGSGGRIRERDVVASANQPASGSHSGLTAVRRTIAQRMVDSHLATAPVTLHTQVDASRLVALRQEYRSSASTGDQVPSYLDFLARLAALALARHPNMNALWRDGRIETVDAVHIGIAVDTDFGLLVPVVRDVLSLGFRELAASSKELAALARARQLTVEQMQGGTFTISNLGNYGVDTFTPILHDGQAAILGVGRIRRQPVVVGEQVVPGDVLSLSLTFDHRINDGGPAARFLQTLCEMIEHPAPALIG